MEEAPRIAPLLNDRLGRQGERQNVEILKICGLHGGEACPVFNGL